MEVVSSSETSLNIYQTTRRNIPEDSHFHGIDKFQFLLHLKLLGFMDLEPG
jgi:hypothetical protein